MSIPTSIAQGTNATPMNPANYNLLVDGISDVVDYYSKEVVFDVTHEDYGAVGDGSTDDEPAIDLARIDATANGGVLYFPGGTANNTYRISTSITFDSDITLVFGPGAKLSIDSGKVVSVSGHIADCVHQIFDGSGTVAGHPQNDFVRPEWWGAIADGLSGTDSSAGIEAATNFADTSDINQVRFLGAEYSIQTAIIFSEVNFITWQGSTGRSSNGATHGGTTIYCEIGNAATHAISLGDCQYWNIIGIAFDGDDDVNAASAIKFHDGAGAINVEGCWFRRFADQGVYIDNDGQLPYWIIFRDCDMSYNAGWGVLCNNLVNNLVFENCWFLHETTGGVSLSGHNHVFEKCVFQNSPVGILANNATISRSWRIQNCHFETMDNNNVMIFDSLSYSYIGPNKANTDQYRVVFDTNCDDNVLIAWHGYVDILNANCQGNTLITPTYAFTNDPVINDNGTDTHYLHMASVDQDGNAVEVEASDPSSLEGESLDETNFATHAKWDTVGDWDDTGGDAVYTHSAGSGTLTQTNANMAIAGVANRRYKFQYTVSAVTNTGTTTATITTGMAETAIVLPVDRAGTFTRYFKAKAVPGDFVISVTSDTASDTFTIDDVTLKEIAAGDVVANGLFTGGGTTGIKVTGAGLVYMTEVATHDLAGDDNEVAMWIDPDDGEMGYNSSSLKAKANITDIDNTDWIYNLQPRTYQRRRKLADLPQKLLPKPGAAPDIGESEAIYSETEFYENTENGLIAEEVFAIEPRVVALKDGEPVAVNESKLVVPLLAEVQKLRAENTLQQTQIDELMVRVAALEAL